MNDTLEDIRRLLMSRGFELVSDSEAVPSGGLLARRGSIHVVAQVTDAEVVAHSGPTFSIHLAPEMPAKHEVAAVPEVPGLRSRLVVEG